MWQARPGLIQSFLQDMAKYFLQFKPHGSNYYVQFLRIMLRKPVAVNIATLNYDLLIEHSIEMLGLRYQHPLAPKMVGTVPVFKLHGSCNIVPDIGDASITGITLVVPPSTEPGVTVAGVAGFGLKACPFRICISSCTSSKPLVPLLAIAGLKDKPTRIVNTYPVCRSCGRQP